MQAKVREITDVTCAQHRTDPTSTSVWADGIVPSSSWSNGVLVPYIYVTPPEDCIQDFDFVATPPTPGTIVKRVDTKIDSYWYGILPEWAKGVRIHSSTNASEARFDDKTKVISEKQIMRGGEIPWPLVFKTAGEDTPWPIAISFGGDVPFPR